MRIFLNNGWIQIERFDPRELGPGTGTIEPRPQCRIGDTGSLSGEVFGAKDGQRGRYGSRFVGVGNHSGMLPWRRAGRATRLVSSILSALISAGRVSAGSITSSM